MTKWIFEYIWMPKNWLNKYPNIFGGLCHDRMNIQIYLGGGKAKNMNTNSICMPFCLFEYLMTQLCLSLLKTGQNKPKLVTNFPNWSSKYICMPKTWPNKYLNLFVGSRIGQANIRIYSEIQEMTKHISEYIPKRPRSSQINLLHTHGW